ncbi:MAG: THUMP domain-containing protein, partial [Candidatus Hydrothermae bacterium]|nr:THUMP domain-containing protein [Candidatus Hydrothermae bacterium]
MTAEYLLRYGELVLKSRRVRDRMIRRLLANLEDAFRREGIPYALQRRWDRLILQTSHPEAAERILSHLFGLRSFSRVQRDTPDSMEVLVERAEAYFREAVQGRTFAVRARRTHDVAWSTRQLERLLGARLVAAGGRVNLDRPEVTCHVDLRTDEVWYYFERNEAPGGLPLGVEPRALALVSGGYDSPVAAWRVMRRGVPLDFLFVALGGCAHLAPVLEVLDRLYCS